MTAHLLWALRRPVARSPLVPTVVIGVTAALAACGKQPAASQTPEFDQLYTARGEVRGLPSSDRLDSAFRIHHEAIPEFVDGTGQIVGMRSMTMDFSTLAPGVSLDGLDVGDRIRFTFGVQWHQGAAARYPTWMVTRIEPLPEGTRLEFDTPADAVQPGDAPEPGASGSAGDSPGPEADAGRDGGHSASGSSPD